MMQDTAGPELPIWLPKDKLGERKGKEVGVGENQILLFVCSIQHVVDYRYCVGEHISECLFLYIIKILEEKCKISRRIMLSLRRCQNLTQPSLNSTLLC